MECTQIEGILGFAVGELEDLGVAGVLGLLYCVHHYCSTAATILLITITLIGWIGWWLMIEYRNSMDCFKL